jgi:hypothetical protein
VLTVLSKNFGPMMRVPNTAHKTPIFFIMEWLLMHEVRVLRRPIPRVLRIFVAREMKPRLITHYVLEGSNRPAQMLFRSHMQ